LAKKANKINANMYSDEGVITKYKDKKKLDKLEKLINKKHDKYRKLVQNFGIRQFIKIDIAHDYDRLNASQVKELAKVYYDAYESGAQSLRHLFKSAISRIEARKEEECSFPNFPKLFAQWEKDKSYYRAELWRLKHKSISVGEFDSQFSIFQRLFLDYQKTANNELHTDMMQERSNIDFFRNKAKILFKYKKLEELIILKENFLQDSKNKNKQDYLALVLAYIAELKSDKVEAIEYYHQIINIEETSLLEDALNRLVSLSIELGDHQNAFFALECLAQISPVYLPYYAESARILGDVLLAIDSYMDYINIFPDDRVTQLKLASLYIVNNMEEAANIMLDYLLLQEPDLEAALVLKRKIS